MKIPTARIYLLGIKGGFCQGAYMKNIPLLHVKLETKWQLIPLLSDCYHMLQNKILILKLVQVVPLSRGMWRNTQMPISDGPLR